MLTIDTSFSRRRLKRRAHRRCAICTCGGRGCGGRPKRLAELSPSGVTILSRPPVRLPSAAVAPPCARSTSRYDLAASDDNEVALMRFRPGRRQLVGLGTLRSFSRLATGRYRRATKRLCPGAGCGWQCLGGHADLGNGGAECRNLPASASYRIARSAFGMGGGIKTSASYTVRGTSGQPYQTGLLQGTNYQVLSGFWAGSASRLA